MEDESSRVLGTNNEIRTILMLAVLHGYVMRAEKDLDKRLSGIPFGKRDFGLIRSRINALLQKVYTTLPLKQLLHMQSLIDRGTVQLDYKRAHVPENWISISGSMVSTICKSLEDFGECKVCMRDGREIDKCPIKEVMEVLCPPDRVVDSKIGCHYRGAVKHD